MQRNILKKLVIESYVDGELNAQRVNEIADFLDRNDLKLYIKALKNWEKEQSIIVDMPLEINEFQEEIKALFPDKKIVMRIDPSLLLGLRLQANDDLYEISLNNTLNKITRHIEEQYD